MLASLLDNLEALSVRSDSSHRGSDSMNRIRPVSGGLVVVGYVRAIAFAGFMGPAIPDHLTHR